MGKQNQKDKKVKRTDRTTADSRTLNQGQGPDFQTQDSEVKMKNRAIETEQGEDSGNAELLPDNNQGDLPSKEKEEIPYIGDNPDETKRESPKLNG
jgi:hypothetical protein